MKKYILYTLIACLASNAFATDYYFHPQAKNNNSGTSYKQPWQSFTKLNGLKLKGGDRILLASGKKFSGTLKLSNISGSKGSPIIISSYDSRGKETSTRAIIDGKGYEAAVNLLSCSYITVRNLELTADGGGFKEKSSNGQKLEMRCGLLAKFTFPKPCAGLSAENLLIYDVFYHDKGFTRPTNDVNTPNGEGFYGFGIRSIGMNNKAIVNGFLIKNCELKNISHTGIKLTHKKGTFNNISVLNNKLLDIGGPAMMIGGADGAVLRGNLTNRSGSRSDGRKWGRGSGFWPWSCSNMLIEKNQFLNAYGPADSCGCHIDFGCSNITVQHNLSVNNYGGFCEILGIAKNVTYRYNVSINDGARDKGRDKATHDGKTIWLSGFAGKIRDAKKGEPQYRSIPPVNSYIYNNTVYVKEGQTAKFVMIGGSDGVLIANNIFHILGSSRKENKTPWQKKNSPPSAPIKNVIFKNNLFLKADNWPADMPIKDSAPFFGNAGFANPGGLTIKDYLPRNTRIIKGKGIRINKLPGDSAGVYTGTAKTDIFGNPLGSSISLGAIQVK